MKNFAVLFLIACSTFASAQNLVPNPSFELYDTCPDFVGQLNRALQWFQPTTGTPDYYNACYDTTQEIYSYAGVPGNIFGRQTPHSGRAYAAAFFEYNELDYREYCEIQLTTPMQPGTKYYVTFYVSLTDSANEATDAFSAYFSVDTIHQNSFSNLPVIPQINNPSGNFITNPSSWTAISGSFIADSAYRFITIGNFKNDANTNYVAVPGGSLTIDYDHGYYYIDDVCVTTDSLPCFTFTGIDKFPAPGDYHLYPNPANESATLEFNNSSRENCTLSLYDDHGKLVRTIVNITADKIEIERNELCNGLYFFQLYNEQRIIATGKLSFE
jgi:hypothetical protein